MPLYIKDPSVAAMAERLRRITRAPSKTDAVRAALAQALDVAEHRLPIAGRLARALALADQIGPANPGFEHKPFFDEQWGG